LQKKRGSLSEERYAGTANRNSAQPAALTDRVKLTSSIERFQLILT
jgi:hypothetical protein